MSRFAVYIDGFNLYHVIDGFEKPWLKWLDHYALAKTFLGNGDALTSVNFYTAVLTWDRNKQARHRTYIAALRAVGCKVTESRFAKVRKHCRAMDMYCYRHEEKQTDVAIATDLIADGVEDHYDTAVLISADSDQVPTIRTFRRLFPNKRLILAAPGNENGARELGLLAHERRPIKEGRLQRCLLPLELHDAHGHLVARIPNAYRRP